jgi:hypothetical protein
MHVRFWEWSRSRTLSLMSMALLKLSSAVLKWHKWCRLAAIMKKVNAGSEWSDGRTIVLTSRHFSNLRVWVRVRVGWGVDRCRFGCGRGHKRRRERGLGGLDLHPGKHPQHSTFYFRNFCLSIFLPFAISTSDVFTWDIITFNIFIVRRFYVSIFL